jgi:hypothetical protein
MHSAQTEETMANFLLVYTGGDNRTPTPEESAAIIKDWNDWMSTLGENLIDGGNPIAPAAKNISSDGTVSNGAVGVAATGYSVVKADSLEAATEVAKGCPHLKMSESGFAV